MKTIEKKVYTAREGAPFKKDEAQVLGEYIEKNNLSTPEEIVQDAIKEESPFHNLIEWNRDEAAEQWNLQQARSIVNHLEVEITYIGGEVEIFARGFEYVVDEGEKRFVTIDEGLSNEDYNKQILQMAILMFQ